MLAQGQMGGMGELGGSRGLSGVLGGHLGAYRGQFYWEQERKAFNSGENLKPYTT